MRERCQCTLGTNTATHTVAGRFVYKRSLNERRHRMQYTVTCSRTHTWLTVAVHSASLKGRSDTDALVSKLGELFLCLYSSYKFTVTFSLSVMASRLPSSFLSVRPSRFTVAVEPLCTVRPLTPRHTPTLTRTNASQAHTSTCTTLKHRNDYSLRSFHTHHRHSADAQTTPTDAPNSTASTEVEVTRRPSKVR